jgi:4-hydroxy-tetrahydrodipicolinate reductase
VVDFSLPEAFDRLLAYCVAHGRPLVSGTTGLSPEQIARSMRRPARIPVLWASNFSLGVAVLADLVERAARALPGWDCDIVEQHHTRKLDAPSGTALTLGEAAARGGAQARYASLRAGDIVGEHPVQFATLGERIELVHPRDQSRHLRPWGAARGRMARPASAGAPPPSPTCWPAARPDRAQTASPQNFGLVIGAAPGTIPARLPPASTDRNRRRVRASLQPKLPIPASRGGGLRPGAIPRPRRSP